VSGSAPKNVIKVAMCALGAYMLMAIGMVVDCRSAMYRRVDQTAFTSGADYGLVLYGLNFTTGAMFDKWGI
jgi:hypothetical protein